MSGELEGIRENNYEGLQRAKDGTRYYEFEVEHWKPERHGGPSASKDEFIEEMQHNQRTIFGLANFLKSLAKSYFPFVRS